METRSWAETKTGVEGDRLCSSLQGPLACCVTPGLRDPSCRALASPCPGNQGPVIHPELPSPWSGGETAEPLVGAGVATTLQCSGRGGGWPCRMVWCRMAPVAHCWAGLLTVGGMVGGSHHQLPLLVIQRPAASPSPPMAWHLESLGLDIPF